jgi:hypothetical protein
MKGTDVSWALKNKTITLETLIARAEIEDVIMRYTHGIDLRDWELFRSVFSDEVYIDYSSAPGAPQPKVWKADEIVQWVKGTLQGFDATEHMFTNLVIDVDGEDAVCVPYLHGPHVLVNRSGGNNLTVGGYYIIKLRRLHGEWRIRSCDLKLTWIEGNYHLLALAHERGAGIP